MPQQLIPVSEQAKLLSEDINKKEAAEGFIYMKKFSRAVAAPTIATHKLKEAYDKGPVKAYTQLMTSLHSRLKALIPEMERELKDHTPKTVVSQPDGNSLQAKMAAAQAKIINENAKKTSQKYTSLLQSNLEDFRKFLKEYEFLLESTWLPQLNARVKAATPPAQAAAGPSQIGTFARSSPAPIAAQAGQAAGLAGPHTPPSPGPRVAVSG